MTLTVKAKSLNLSKTSVTLFLMGRFDLYLDKSALVTNLTFSKYDIDIHMTLTDKCKLLNLCKVECGTVCGGSSLFTIIGQYLNPKSVLFSTVCTVFQSYWKISYINITTVTFLNDLLLLCYRIILQLLQNGYKMKSALQKSGKTADICIKLIKDSSEFKFG